MEINSKIPFIDVVTVAKSLCEYVTSEEHEIIYVPVTLKDNGESKKYLSVLICKKDEIEPVLIEYAKMGEMSKEEYSVNKGYCHIATFPEDIKRREVDFDFNSDSPIKADINEEYSYVDRFFKMFIRFRNNLIENRQVVKRDDIYQYFLSLTGFNQDTNKKHHKSK